jgi:hypothetical protein
MLPQQSNTSLFTSAHHGGLLVNVIQTCNALTSTDRDGYLQSGLKAKTDKAISTART